MQPTSSDGLGALAAVASALAGPPSRRAHPIAPMPLPPASSSAEAIRIPYNIPTPKPKQRRYRASPDQLRELVATFEASSSPTAAELAALAARISMPTQSVVLWFKNRRARVPHKKAEKERKMAMARAESQRRAQVDGVNAAVAMAELGLPRRPSMLLPGPQAHVPQAPPLAPRPLVPVQPPVMMSQSLATLCSAAQQSEQHPKPGSMQPTMPHPPPPPSIPGSWALPIHQQPVGIARASRPEPPQHLVVSQQAPAPLLPIQLTLPSKDFDARRSAAALQQMAATNNGYPASHAPHGSEPHAAQATPTPRRPRAMASARTLQHPFEIGDKIELMIQDEEELPAWVPAIFLAFLEPKPEPHLSTSKRLGVDGTAGSATSDRGESDGSPRTVQSPLASPNARARFLIGHGDKEEVVGGDQIRPTPPPDSSWTPTIGDTVEAFAKGMWMGGVVRKFSASKGWLVAFHTLETFWISPNAVRTCLMWKGAQQWIRLNKAKHNSDVVGANSAMFVNVARNNKATHSTTSSDSLPAALEKPQTQPQTNNNNGHTSNKEPKAEQQMAESDAGRNGAAEHDDVEVETVEDRSAAKKAARGRKRKAGDGHPRRSMRKRKPNKLFEGQDKV